MYSTKNVLEKLNKTIIKLSTFQTHLKTYLLRSLLLDFLLHMFFVFLYCLHWCCEYLMCMYRSYRCDACDGFIVGTRVHCLECEDFDLCNGCFNAGRTPKRSYFNAQFSPQFFFFSPLIYHISLLSVWRYPETQRCWWWCPQ